jgi:hypothetical protein
VKSTVSNLVDPIDTTLARSFVGDTSSDELAPEVFDQLVDETLKVSPSLEGDVRRFARLRRPRSGWGSSPHF